MFYDAFISHASEDKEPFVRLLAESLRAKNVAVWYDEFTLRVGDSLRKSIDHGLSKSRFGIVVFSKSFFSKPWPQWELSGLVQLQTNAKSPVILPIWLDVTRDDVLQFSPPLADLYAISPADDIATVIEKLLEVISPQGSSLIVARDRLLEVGFDPPAVTDDWWHKAIEYCGSNPEEGTFQEAMGWGRWGFPLPPSGKTAAEKGVRIAGAALQMNWQRCAKKQRISQITHPDEIRAFIEQTIGLRAACTEFPHYLASYAPQLIIPGFGGDFELLFDEWHTASRAEQAVRKAQGSQCGIALTTNGELPLCDEVMALHDPDFGNYEPASVACHFVQGFAVSFGPPTQVFDTIDYIAWFLSKSSLWMPSHCHEFLLTGLRGWATWQWDVHMGATEYPSSATTGSLFEQMFRARRVEKFRLSKNAKQDIIDRLGFSVRRLDLPESPSELCERFIDAGFIERWILERKVRISRR